MPESPERRPELVALGKMVNALRTRKKLTLDDLAEETALSRRYLSQIERGLANPSIATLLKIAEALGTRASRLLALAEADPGD